MKTHAEFHEKLGIITAILFPDASNADTGQEPRPPLPEGADHETLRSFCRAFARHREFLKGQYEVCLPEMSCTWTLPEMQSPWICPRKTFFSI